MIKNICKTAEGFFDSVANIVRKILKEEIQYNYTITGVVVSDNLNGTYEVRINDSTITVKSLHGQTYLVNDVVYIIVLNKDFRKKLILDKVY